MRYLHTIFIILFFILSAFFSFGVQETFADRYITQVNERSNSTKVKKLQEVFKGLGLYNGEIDGNFSSIREALVDYQVENGIIPDREHEEAGYFGNKTIKSLKQRFGKDFEDLQKEYLVLEAPAVDQEGYFIVTAYYSPLLGQEKYSTGSYESEIKLNGGGNTASGKKPSAGTIAGPRNYAFGTKIFLEGFGVGVVEDRGGAIVNSGDNGHLHDRLDIWMGYGDEARERTRKWGVRTVKGKILPENSEVSILFEDIKNSEENVIEKTSNYVISSNSKKESKIEKYKNLYISPEKLVLDDVKKLQELFKEVKIYNGEIDGDFSSIKNILIDFQVDNGIIASYDSKEAGYFGKKTYEVFRKKFGENFELEYKIKIYELSNDEKYLILNASDNFLKVSKKIYSGDKYDKYIEESKDKLNSIYKKINDSRKKAIIKYFLQNI